MGAIETNRIVVSLVIVYWALLNGVLSDEAIGLGSIMFVEGKDMV